MNIPETPNHRTAVSLNDIQDKVKKTTYTVLPDSKTTVCLLHMANGYTIMGTSSCVDPAEFNKALGEKYSYEDATNKAWPLEGYLLAEEIFLRKPVPSTYSWGDVAAYAMQADHMTGDTKFKVSMRDGSAFDGVINHDHRGESMSPEQMIVANINKQTLESITA